ncbi:DUF5320 domain-containing protein [Candidatus Bathyarchaeota archaeon]|nr:DUF5320 domain-containing protein [Candidatus Bathyarchaeota archaeon]
MHRHHGCHGYSCGCHGFKSVEDEVVMLEKAKDHIESQLAIVNERLEKLKE